MACPLKGVNTERKEMLCLRSSMVMLAITKPTGQCPLSTQSYLRLSKGLENQDGGIDRHTAPPCTTRTDRKSNGKEVRHQVDKKETFIQTGRRGRDRQPGRRGLPLPCGTETGNQDWRSVGQTGQAV